MKKPPRSAKARRVVVTLELETDAKLAALRHINRVSLVVDDGGRLIEPIILQASANVIKPDTLRARAKRGGRA